MNKTIILSLLLSFCLPCAAQEFKPELNKAIEDYTFNRVKHFKTASVSISDFRGKWLLLDFYSHSCRTNTRILPMVNELYKEFRQEMNFLVAATDGNELRGVEGIFETLHDMMDLELPVAYDSVLYRKWGIRTMPYVIIVDPTGVIRAISSGVDLTPKEIRALLDGQETDLPDNSKRNSRYVRTSDPNMLYSAKVTPWKGERGTATPFDEFVQWSPDVRQRSGLLFTAESLKSLYATPYMDSDGATARYYRGELFYPYPEIRVKDPAPFDVDPLLGDLRGRYNFEFYLPPSRSTNEYDVRAAMKQELKNIFGYDVSIEPQVVTVWRLLAKPGAEAKLRTKHASTKIVSTPVELTLQNVPIDKMCKFIIYPLITQDRVWINANETGLTGNVDVSIHCLTDNIDQMNRELERYGLYLVEEKVRLAVVVISDPM